MGYDLDERSNELDFDDKDIENGAYIPWRGKDGVISFRRKPKNPKSRYKYGGNSTKMGHNPRGPDDLTLAMFKATMAALWRDGETYPEIARQVNEKFDLQEDGEGGYTANDIHYHIKQMLAYWRTLIASRIDERQAMALARLDQIEQIAIEAYFASVQGKRTTTHSKQIERARSKDREKQLLEAEYRDRRETALTLPWQKKNKPQINVPDDFEGQAQLLIQTADKRNKITRSESNPAGDPKWMTLVFNINRERAKILGLYAKDAASDPDRDAARLTDEQREQRLANIIQQAKQRRSDVIDQALAAPAPLGGFDEQPELEQEDVPEVEDWGFEEVENPESWD